MSRYDFQIPLSFKHRIVFTRDVFGAGLRDLAEVLERHPGDVDVEFRVLTASGARVFALPHKVAPSGGLYAEIKRILGPNCFD